MEWSEQHDVALMKEVKVQNPFKAKKKTSNRAQIWLSIAEAPSGLKDPLFKDSMTKRLARSCKISTFCWQTSIE